MPPNKTEEKREEARQIVESLTVLKRDVDEFPVDIEEARLQLALQDLDGALATPTGKNLTREQLAAAVLMGRGATFGETALALGITEGHLHYWDSTNASFRRQVAIFRERLEMDIEGRLYQSVKAMMERADGMSSTDQIRLAALCQKIASRPEDRARWAAEISIKREQLALQREEIEKAKQDEKNPRVTDAIEGAAEDIWDGIVELESDDGDL